MSWLGDLLGILSDTHKHKDGTVGRDIDIKDKGGEGKTLQKMHVTEYESGASDEPERVKLLKDVTKSAEEEYRKKHGK